jgi:hypothetical protein
MAFIAPTQRIVTQVVPTTMPALGDLTTALSSIGAGILNYYNTTTTGAVGSTTMTADMQAALLAQQQQDSTNTALMVGAAAVGAVALIWFKMRKHSKKGSK